MHACVREFTFSKYSVNLYIPTSDFLEHFILRCGLCICSVHVVSYHRLATNSLMCSISPLLKYLVEHHYIKLWSIQFPCVRNYCLTFHSCNVSAQKGCGVSGIKAKRHSWNTTLRVSSSVSRFYRATNATPAHHSNLSWLQDCNFFFVCRTILTMTCQSDSELLSGDR